MSKYYVDGFKNVRLETKEIEANTPEEAKEIYTRMVTNGEVEIIPQWHTYSAGDCNEPDKVKESYGNSRELEGHTQGGIDSLEDILQLESDYLSDGHTLYFRKAIESRIRDLERLQSQKGTK